MRTAHGAHQLALVENARKACGADAARFGSTCRKFFFGGGGEPAMLRAWQRARAFVACICMNARGWRCTRKKLPAQSPSNSFCPSVRLKVRVWQWYTAQ
eukprot:2268674-Pleurochrysis_carterae.AAC.1